MAETIILGGGAGALPASTGGESWFDKLIPIGLLLVVAYMAYEYFMGSSQGASSTTDTGGGTGGGTTGGTTSYTVTGDTAGLKGATVEVPSSFATNLEATYTGAPSSNPANVLSGASWTKFAQPASAALSALVKSWTPPGQPALIALQSGGESDIAGQVAVYNPETGNAWGGNISTVQALYGSGDVTCDPGDANCLAEQAWLKRYG